MTTLPTTDTDPALVILDRAAAGKPLTADEVALLRARLDRNPLISDQEAELRRQVERLQQILAGRRLMQREFTAHAQEQAEQIRDLTARLDRSERRRRDVQAHLDYAHQTITAMRETQ